MALLKPVSSVGNDTPGEVPILASVSSDKPASGVPSVAVRCVLFAPWAAVAAAYVLLVAAVYRYAIDIPYLDEWDVLYPGELERPLSLRWIFERHGDHLIVPTQLMTWLMFRLTGLNERISQLVNVALFGGLLVAIAWSARQGRARFPWPLTGAFLLPLLSPNCWDNHLWSFQSQFHFCLIGFVCAPVLLFSLRKRFSAWRLVGGCGALVLGIVSFSAGVPAALACTLGCIGERVARMRGEGRADRLRSILVVLAVTASTGAALLLWCSGFAKLEHGSSDLASPTTLTFWNFLARQISFGFGFKSLSLWLAYGCMALTLLPFCLLLLFRANESGPSPERWLHGTMVLGGIGALAGVAYGRASFENYERLSRYSELGMALIIPTACLWWQALEPWVRLRRGAMAALLVLLAAGYSDGWSYAATFGRGSQQFMEGRECAYGFMRNGGEAHCGALYPWPITRQLEHAKSLHLSFYRRFEHEERVARRLRLARRRSRD